MSGKVKVLNVNMAVLDENGFEEKLEGVFDAGERIIIGKVNTEFLQRAYKSKEFADTLSSFDINVADGVGVLWAAKYLSLPTIKIPILKQLQCIWQMVYSGASLIFYPQFCKSPLPHAFRGVDMMGKMLSFASKKNVSVYILGGEEKILKKVISNISKENSNVNIVGFSEGYHFDNDDVLEEINQSGAEMLFVALGSPKQEYWIRDNITKLKNIRVAVGEGGSLDFIAGSFVRAPRFLRIISLEWLWRLFANKSKSHTGKRKKRVFEAVPLFVYNVVRHKIKADHEKKSSYNL